MGTLANETTRTQLYLIREHLIEHGEIDKKTSLMLYDCDRLGARIFDLRNDLEEPMQIVTVRVTKKNRLGHPTTYAVYRLVGEV